MSNPDLASIYNLPAKEDTIKSNIKTKSVATPSSVEFSDRPETKVTSMANTASDTTFAISPFLATPLIQGPTTVGPDMEVYKALFFIFIFSWCFLVEKYYKGEGRDRESGDRESGDRERDKGERDDREGDEGESDKGERDKGETYGSRNPCSRTKIHNYFIAPFLCKLLM